MRVGYILDQFPSLSETFILREMKALAERGFEIIPLALSTDPSELVHEDARPFVERMVRRPSFASAAFWGACCRAFVRVPGRCVVVKVSHVVGSLGRSWPFCRLMGAFYSAAAFTPSALDLELERIHAQFGSYPGLVGMLLHRLTRIPFSFSMHARDVFAEVSPFLREQLAEADFVTVCTEHCASIVRSVARPEDAGKIHLVYHGVDIEGFDRLLSAATGRPAEGPAKIVSVGRLVPKKGFDVLLRACARLKKEGREFRLTIIGDGPERQRLARTAAELTLGKSIYLQGRQPLPEVASALARGDVFALASVIAADGDRDGLPNVILEAMAAGLPVVASRLGGIPEAVTDGETGLLVEPGDEEALAEGLGRLLDDPALREKLGEAGRKVVVERFDVRQNVAKLAELMQLGIRM